MQVSKAKKWISFIAVCAIAAFVLTFAALTVTAAPENTETVTTGTTVTVTVDGEETEYDLADSEGAQAYLDNYADNLNADENFKENYDVALKTVRGSVKTYASFWSIVPPIIAILLALITKEVYSSLFVGILVGGLLYSNFNFEGTVVHVFSDGFVGSLADSYNVGILIFLVMLGAMVAMMNKAGGSAAFGKWASTHIKSRLGTQLATILLGVLVFVDDYFNCLTVGSVMRPVTDKQNIS
ncbi:MAG: hypothetical protein PUF48_02550, partial [Oscillospiraceae bacterium]|nr:hypothetical protein [Oscillospiraceae bacterium]